MTGSQCVAWLFLPHAPSAATMRCRSVSSVWWPLLWAIWCCSRA